MAVDRTQRVYRSALHIIICCTAALCRLVLEAMVIINHLPGLEPRQVQCGSCYSCFLSYNMPSEVLMTRKSAFDMENKTGPVEIKEEDGREVCRSDLTPPERLSRWMGVAVAPHPIKDILEPVIAVIAVFATSQFPSARPARWSPRIHT